MNESKTIMEEIDSKDDIYLKLLLKYYETESKEHDAIRLLKLRDSILKAYNQQLGLKLKGFHLVDELKKNEDSFRPYDWQKLFFDIFTENNKKTDTNQVKNFIKELLRTHLYIKKENEIEIMDVHEENGEPKNTKDSIVDVPGSELSPSGDKVDSVGCPSEFTIVNIPEKSLSHQTDLIESTPSPTTLNGFKIPKIMASDSFESTSKDSPLPPVRTIDYQAMSVYELKRALLVSKLELLDAQEAHRRAKENIRLIEEEHLRRQIDKD
ncbi:uncharacterized protein LOC129905629 [Episyrphus balteatus]|uniref:uncharacterized protein LOC129905629 n=1 Tax=Episyrphus balteatus TaxID=286459 RepID=UPI0024855F8A|nr:uncharacterized protein LOC129905629 [Episyrphus balteatus]